MEYSTDATFATAHDCENGETAGLAEGTYYVRYKETGTSEASDYAEVKVALNSVTVVGGTGSGKYAAGASVTVKVTVPTGKISRGSHGDGKCSCNRYALRQVGSHRT